MRIPQGPGLRGRLTAWLGAALALALAGCGGQGAREHPRQAAEPRRVVCGTPAVAEIVYALGGGDRVVGVSAFTDWPPDAAAKPSIGDALSPNRERILALAPDAILTQGRSDSLARFAQTHGIAFLSLPLDTLADLRAAIAAYAAALGAEAAGERLLRDMDAAFDALAPSEPVGVFVALGHAPGDLSGLMTTGPGTFLHELVALAGGSNVFSDVRILWPKVSRESLVRRAPDAILDVQSVALDDARRAALVADWERLGFRPDQVRLLEEDYLLRPGPRAPLSAARIAAALAPSPIGVSP
jgi:iron complex transport system substrate-binding protein